MPECEHCGTTCANLAQHRSEFHSVPPDMLIDGVSTRFYRGGPDNALKCPVSGCSNTHTRRSNFVRHLKDHGAVVTTPQLNGKRSLSSSVESLTDGARKKTKLVVNKVGKVFKSASMFFFFFLFTADKVPLEFKPLTMKRLLIRSSDAESISSELASPVLSSSLPSSPCPLKGQAVDLGQRTGTSIGLSGMFCYLDFKGIPE